MFSGPPGNLFSILTNVVFTSSFVYLCYNICIFSHCVYKKSAKIINFFKTQKKTIKPKKPNPYPIKGQTGIGFFWVIPPPPPPQMIPFWVGGEILPFSEMIPFFLGNCGPFIKWYHFCWENFGPFLKWFVGEF